jgi:glycosyltransferase involved in cell wall biosynthesis
VSHQDAVPTGKSDQTLVSFIIPHKGRETLLEQTIASIDAQVRVPGSIEIIVVTQNEHLEIADRRSDIRINYAEAQATIASLRNRGVAIAHGTYLAFIDADIDLAPEWLVTMWELLVDQQNRVLVASTQKCAAEASLAERIRVAISSLNGDRPVKFLSAPNLFMRRSEFDLTDGFPEHLTTCEDSVFTNTMAARGEVYCTSKAQFVHLGEDKNWREYFRKEVWRGRSNLRSVNGRSIPLRELPSLVLPFWCGFWMVSMFVSAVLVKPSALGLSIALLLLPAVLYAARLQHNVHGAVTFSAGFIFYIVGFTARAIGGIWGLTLEKSHRS